MFKCNIGAASRRGLRACGLTAPPVRHAFPRARPSVDSEAPLMNSTLDVIFLVRDDAAHQKQLEHLAYLGFKIRACTELIEVYDNCAAHACPLVILSAPLADIHIAAARLRAIDRRVGIIAMEAFADSESRIRTLLCGADACLPTDVSGLELAAVLQALLRRIVALAPLPETAELARGSEPGIDLGMEALALEPAMAPPDSKWHLTNQGWTLVSPGGRTLGLTTGEREFLSRLMRAPERKISREALAIRPGGVLATMRDASNPFALKWVLSRTDTEQQDVVVLTARMMGAGGPEYVDDQLFSEYEQMLFTKAVSVAESFGKHVSLLVVPAGDIFAALVQTANNLEVDALVSGLSHRMTAQEQAVHVGQAWENLPEPKRQFTFYVISSNGEAQAFHIGPHAPTLQAEDVQLVHRLWLNFKRDPEMGNLHHHDIVTYALTRLAGEYARDKEETLKGLRRFAHDGTKSPTLGLPGSQRRDPKDYSIPAPGIGGGNVDDIDG